MAEAGRAQAPETWTGFYFSSSPGPHPWSFNVPLQPLDEFRIFGTRWRRSFGVAVPPVSAVVKADGTFEFSNGPPGEYEFGEPTLLAFGATELRAYDLGGRQPWLDSDPDVNDVWATNLDGAQF